MHKREDDFELLSLGFFSSNSSYTFFFTFTTSLWLTQRFITPGKEKVNTAKNGDLQP